MSVVVLDEAHLVVEWQVFDICLALFPFTTVKGTVGIFLSNYALGTKNVTSKIMNLFWNSQRVFL